MLKAPSFAAQPFRPFVPIYAVCQFVVADCQDPNENIEFLALQLPLAGRLAGVFRALFRRGGYWDVGLFWDHNRN